MLMMKLIDKLRETPFPNGKLLLLDGRMIDGYPVATDETDSVNDDTLNIEKKGQCVSVQKPSSNNTDKKKEMELFLKNAFRFQANKERILTDSRMFLCPIPVQSGMTISGTFGFMNPTLGVYLQWWDVCPGALRTDENGRRSLVFKLSGSNLSGVNKSGEVFEDGSIGYDCLRPFKSYWYPFVKINNVYTEAKNKYQAYTLEQVTEILEHENMDDMAYAHTINERFHAAEIKALNERVGYLNAQNKALEERYQNAMLRWKEDRIVKYYDEYVALEMRVESEVSMLSEHKRELRAALRRGEYTNKEYEPLVIPINKQIENAKTELSLFKYSELNRIFPQDHIPFCQIEEYVKKLKENEQK